MTTKLVTDYFREIGRFIEKIKTNPILNCQTDIDFKLKLLDDLSRSELDADMYLDFSEKRQENTIKRIDIFIKELKDAFCDSKKDFEIWDKSISDIKKDVAKGKIFVYYPKDIKNENDHLKLNEAILYTILSRFEHIREILNPTRITAKSPFSALQWAAIFYYADEVHLLPEARTKKIRIEQFISKHQIKISFDYFKKKYSETKTRINKKADYPINKLEAIIPFIKKNYKQAINRVHNDISYLEDKKKEKEKEFEY